jgi:hypothetical protein
MRDLTGERLGEHGPPPPRRTRTTSGEGETGSGRLIVRRAATGEVGGPGTILLLAFVPFELLLTCLVCGGDILTLWPAGAATGGEGGIATIVLLFVPDELLLTCRVCGGDILAAWSAGAATGEVGGIATILLLFVPDELLLTCLVCGGGILALWPARVASAAAAAPATAADVAAADADAAFFLALGGVLRYSQLGTGCFSARVAGYGWAASCSPALAAVTGASSSASPVGFVVGGGVLVLSFPAGEVDVMSGVVAEAHCSLPGSSVGMVGSVPCGSVVAVVVGVVLPRSERRRTVTVLLTTVGFFVWIGLPEPAASPFGLVVCGVLVLSSSVDVVGAVAAEACCTLEGSAIGKGGDSVPGSEVATVEGVVLPRRERRRTVTVLLTTVCFLALFGLPEHVVVVVVVVVVSCGALVVSFPGVAGVVRVGVVAEQASCLLAGAAVGTSAVLGSTGLPAVVGTLPRREWRRRTIILFNVFGGPFAESRRVTVFCW